MGKLLFSELAWNDYINWLQEDRKTVKRINNIIKDIERNGYNGIAKPEPLKGDYSGFWSRRIDDKNRIIYRVSGDIIEIASIKGHYND